jgi:uncharacterized protein (DUF433 family)
VVSSYREANDMTLTIEAMPAPLESTGDGMVRVRGSRVTLDTVVGAFEQGKSSEEIALHYLSLQLADIYGVISYYLRHQGAVSAYLEQRDRAAAAVRREVERRTPQAGIRARLLARAGRGTGSCSSLTRTSTTISFAIWHVVSQALILSECRMWVWLARVTAQCWPGRPQPAASS